MKMKISLKKTVLWLLFLSPVWYVTACHVISHNKEKGYAMIQPGAAREAVIAEIGMPSHVELQGKLFERYASTPCQEPCVVRLWYENRLTLGMEAWSVTLDKHDRVLEKYHWISP